MSADSYQQHWIWKENQVILEYSYWCHGWKKANAFCISYHENGQIAETKHRGTQTMKDKNLEETKKYFRELFQKQNYFGKEYLAVKSEIAKQLYLLMQTNLQAPTITIVKHKEGSFYKDWWFSLNGVEGVQFLYYYNTETQEHRITQLKPHADKSNYFGVYIHDNFFGTHTERIMEALKNHPSIRLKLLLN